MWKKLSSNLMRSTQIIVQGINKSLRMFFVFLADFVVIQKMGHRIFTKLNQQH